MPRLARSKHRPRAGSLPARKRRSRLSRTGYLANPASLIGIPRLQPVHAGNKISFGSSALTALAQALVEIDQADESDWIAAEKTLRRSSPIRRLGRFRPGPGPVR